MLAGRLFANSIQNRVIDPTVVVSRSVLGVFSWFFLSFQLETLIFVLCIFFVVARRVGFFGIPVGGMLAHSVYL